MRSSIKIAMALAAAGALFSLIGCKPAQSRGYETGDGIPAVPTNAINSNATGDNGL